MIWYQKRSALPRISFFLWLEMWLEFYLEMVSWMLLLSAVKYAGFYFFPHNIWTLGHMFCGTKERFIAYLWISFFFLTSRSQYLSFNVFLSFKKLTKKLNLYHKETFLLNFIVQNRSTIDNQYQKSYNNLQKTLSCNLL